MPCNCSCRFVRTGVSLFTLILFSIDETFLYFLFDVCCSRFFSPSQRLIVLRVCLCDAVLSLRQALSMSPVNTAQCRPLVHFRLCVCAPPSIDLRVCFGFVDHPDDAAHLRVTCRTPSTPRFCSQFSCLRTYAIDFVEISLRCRDPYSSTDTYMYMYVRCTLHSILQAVFELGQEMLSHFFIRSTGFGFHRNARNTPKILLTSASGCGWSVSV